MTREVQSFCSAQGDHNKQQVAFHQPDRNRIADGLKYAQFGGLGLRLLAAALLLLGFERGIGVGPKVLLPRVMLGAFGIGAYLAHLAFLAALGDDGFGSVFARAVLRPIALLFLLRLVLTDFDVLVARDRCATPLCKATNLPRASHRDGLAAHRKVVLPFAPRDF